MSKSTIVTLSATPLVSALAGTASIAVSRLLCWEAGYQYEPWVVLLVGTMASCSATLAWLVARGTA